MPDPTLPEPTVKAPTELDRLRMLWFMMRSDYQRNLTASMTDANTFEVLNTDQRLSNLNQIVQSALDGFVAQG